MPADTPDRLAARHAIRSAAILALVGGTVMVSGTVGAKLGNAAVLFDGDASTGVQWTDNIDIRPETGAMVSARVTEW